MSNDFIENEIANEFRSGMPKNEAIIKHNDSSAIRSDHTENDNTIFTTSKELTESNTESEENDENVNETNEKKDEWVDILGSGGIMKKTIIEGKPGTQPTRTEKCTINYTCSLEDGTIADTKTNFSFFLGESDVISGLDVSIALLNIGEKCLLKIEPRLAFGKTGLPPMIPPNAIILYEIELVSVEPEDEIESLTLQQRQMTGNKKRERGNWWYTRGENNLAIQCYRRALDYLDEVESNSFSEEGKKSQLSDSDLQSILEDRISVYNNMAAAQIKMQMYDAALNSLQTVLRCQPNNLKAHFRKAKAYVGKNEPHMAMKCLRKARELAPEDVEVQKEISRVAKIMESQKASERELARRMFNGPSEKNDSENSKKKLQNQSKMKVGMWTTVVALVAVGIASLVAHRLKYS